MKKTNAKERPIRRKERSSAVIMSEQVTPKEVVTQLLELYKQLGIEINGPTIAAIVSASRLKLPALYPHAAAIGGLLTTWHQDPDFLDGQGNPLAIRKHGRRPSFRSLTRRSVRNVEEKTLLLELEALGAISVDTADLVHVHMRSIPAYEDRQLAIQHTLASLDGFIRTLRHNLNSPRSNAEQLFHRIAQCSDFNAKELATLKIRVRRMGQHFLESFDDWLMRQSLSNGQNRIGGKKFAKVSVGVYLSVKGGARTKIR